MKIVLLADDFPPESFGGAGISTFELARGLRRAGEEVIIVTTCRKKEDAVRSTYEGLTVYKIASNYSPRWRSYRSINNPPVVKQVEKILSSILPDVVHAHNIHHHLSFRSLWVARKYAKAVIFTARDAMTVTFGKLETSSYLERRDARTTWLDHVAQAGKRWNPLRNVFIRGYLAYADRIVAISQALKRALEENGIGNIEVIYNGIDAGEWEVSEQSIKEFRSRFGLVDKQVLLFSGRLSSQKGGEQALLALERIAKKAPRAVLLVAGAVDEYGKQMQQRAEELGLTERLVFTGWLDRELIKVAYAAADVVLMLSVYLDAFGRVNIEAMAARKPVVGTVFGGTPEIVLDNVTGYIINPLFPEEIATKTLDLLESPQKAKVFGAAGYERVIRLFSLAESVQKYVALYRACMTNSTPRVTSSRS